MKACMRCGHVPPEGAQVCNSCGASLIEGPPPYPPQQGYYPPPQNIGIGTGMKLAIGGCLGVLLLMGACTVFFGVIGKRAIDEAKKQEDSTFSSPSGSTARTSTGKLTAVNKTFDFKGLKLTVRGVEVRPDRVMVSMLLVNTTGQKFTLYPSQGNATIGRMQLDCNTFLGDGDLSGDIQAGVEKRGGLTFMVPSGEKLDPDSVSAIKLDLGTLFDQRYQSQQMEFTVAL